MFFLDFGIFWVILSDFLDLAEGICRDHCF